MSVYLRRQHITGFKERLYPENIFMDIIKVKSQRPVKRITGN